MRKINMHDDHRCLKRKIRKEIEYLCDNPNELFLNYQAEFRLSDDRMDEIKTPTKNLSGIELWYALQPLAVEITEIKQYAPCEDRNCRYNYDIDNDRYDKRKKFFSSLTDIRTYVDSFPIEYGKYGNPTQDELVSMIRYDDDFEYDADVSDVIDRVFAEIFPE